MKHSVVLLILAVSVLFNVFFVAGYFKARSEQQEYIENISLDATAVDDDQITRLVSRELDLNEDQQVVFRQLHGAMREDAGTFQANIQLLQQKLIAELQKPDPDLALMQEIVEEQATLHQQRRQIEAARFGQFVDVLTPPQRDKLSDRLRPRDRDRSRRHRELLMQFDRDGDGVLNDEERAEAETYFKELRERQQREREQAREELRRRFDVNNDGELDEEELKAMHRWMRENWGERSRGERGDRTPGPKPPHASNGAGAPQRSDDSAPQHQPDVE